MNMRSIKTKPRTIDEYLTLTTPRQRAALEKLRKAIHAAAPGVEEYIGYGLAGFKFNKRPLVYFGAWDTHCALYAASLAVQKKFQKETESLRVQQRDDSLHAGEAIAPLVKALVKARLAENAG